MSRSPVCEYIYIRISRKRNGTQNIRIIERRLKRTSNNNRKIHKIKSNRIHSSVTHRARTQTHTDIRTVAHWTTFLPYFSLLLTRLLVCSWTWKNMIFYVSVGSFGLVKIAWKSLVCVWLCVSTRAEKKNKYMRKHTETNWRNSSLCESNSHKTPAAVAAVAAVFYFLLLLLLFVCDALCVGVSPYVICFVIRSRCFVSLLFFRYFSMSLLVAAAVAVCANVSHLHFCALKHLIFYYYTLFRTLFSFLLSFSTLFLHFLFYFFFILFSFAFVVHSMAVAPMFLVWIAKKEKKNKKVEKKKKRGKIKS